MFTRSALTPTLVTTILVVATTTMLASQSAATPAPTFLEGAFKRICSNVKEYFEDKVQQNIIDSSDIMREYRKVVQAASDRFEAKLDAGELPGDDEEELTNIFNRMVIDELERFRASIEKGRLEETASTDDLDASTKQCLDGGDDEDSDDDNLWPGWNPKVMTEKQDLNNRELIEAHERADRNKALIKQLLSEAKDKDELESNLELAARLEKEDREMGAGLSEETRKKLRAKTHTVLKDLIENEARVIATTVISAYMTGDGTEGIKKVLAPLLTAIKQKLVSFLINVVSEVLHSMVGDPQQTTKQITEAGETDEGELKQEHQLIQAHSHLEPQPRPLAVEA